MTPGTGDQGLQVLGWTAEDISLMDEEDKKKMLQHQINKPGTKKSPQAPGQPKAPTSPAAPPAAGTPAVPSSGPAPAPAPAPAPVPPAAAARMAKLMERKLNQRRVIRGQEVAAPAAPAPAQPAAPAPAPAAPATPAPKAPAGTPPPAAEEALDSIEEMTDEQKAFQILSEVQQSKVEATTPDQVTSIKASQLAQRLLTEVGMTMTEARDLFGLASNKSFSSLLS